MKDDIKMSDAFVLPVSRHNGDLFNSKNPITDTRFAKFFSMEQFKKAEYAAIAINNYDRLVAENERQAEQIKRLLLEKTTRANIANTHVFIDSAEFNSLATFVMCNGGENQDADMDDVSSVLDQIAVKCLGYDNWIDAYHSIEV